MKHNPYVTPEWVQAAIDVIALVDEILPAEDTVRSLVRKSNLMQEDEHKTLAHLARSLRSLRNEKMRLIKVESLIESGALNEAIRNENSELEVQDYEGRDSVGS